MLTYETTGAVELDNAALAALTFLTQKNGMTGEVTHNGIHWGPTHLLHTSSGLMPTAPPTAHKST